MEAIMNLTLDNDHGRFSMDPFVWAKVCTELQDVDVNDLRAAYALLSYRQEPCTHPHSRGEFVAMFGDCYGDSVTGLIEAINNLVSEAQVANDASANSRDGCCNLSIPELAGDTFYRCPDCGTAWTGSNGWEIASS